MVILSKVANLFLSLCHLLLSKVYNLQNLIEIFIYAAGRRPNMTSQRRNSQSNNDSPTSNNNNNTHGHRRRNSAVENMGNFPTSNVELHMNSSDVWEALIAIREARMRQRNEREFHLDVERRDNQWMQRQNRNNVVSVNMPRASHTVCHSEFLLF